MPSYNPLADHLFWPTMALLAALLGGAYGALLLVMRGDRARLRASVLYQRWRVWAIIARSTVWPSSAAPYPHWRC